MNKHELKNERKSYMEIGEIYFWTTTINQWQKLLWIDEYKDIITGSLEYLSNARKIDVFGFVIMPTHLHLIWRLKELNGKENPQKSFAKFTAHEFQKKLSLDEKERLHLYRVDARNKEHEFWRRDPLAIPLYTRKVAFQKLDYMHYNPMAGKWKLAKDPCDYKYSSARFYEFGDKSFSFLKDLREEF